MFGELEDSVCTKKNWWAWSEGFEDVWKSVEVEMGMAYLGFGGQTLEMDETAL